MTTHVSITVTFPFTGVPNRDRALQAKVMNWSGTQRIYMSRQAFRRAMRDQREAPLADIAGEDQLAIRSRVTVHQSLLPELERQGLKAERARALAEIAGAMISELKEGGSWSAPVVLGRAEVTALAGALAALETSDADAILESKDGPKALAKALGQARGDALRSMASVGLEAILFGRMVTTTALADIDGVIASSPAISIGAASVTGDFFVANDDLLGGVGEGTSHMGNVPWVSDTFVAEIIVDGTILARELPEGIAAADVVDWVVRAVIAAPTKLARAGSTGAPNGAEDVVVAIGPRPLSAMGAFQRPSSLTSEEAGELARDRMLLVDRRYGGGAEVIRLGDLDGGIPELRARVREVVETSAMSVVAE